MLTSEAIKKVVTEARPLIEQQLDLAEQIAGLRDVVAAAGGDWGQLKALVKAQIQDERDDAGSGKRVRKYLDKADFAAAYADMLGIRANMNEENFSAEEFDPDTGEITEPAHSEPSGVAADQASEAEPRAEVSLATPLQEGSEPIEAHNLDRAGSTPAPATSHPTLGVGGSGESPGEATEEAARAPASSVVPITRDIRPWCLHKNDLSKCGGYGRQHCHSCLKAHADESGEAA